MFNRIECKINKIRMKIKIKMKIKSVNGKAALNLIL